MLLRASNPPEIWAGGWAGSPTRPGGAGLFFRGSVREAVRLFPCNLNVAVNVALVGLGLDRTDAELHADPAITQATFEVQIEAGPGSAVLRVEGRRTPAGHDPADYTAFSVLRLLRRRHARVAI